MRSESWDRAAVIETVADDVWRFVTQAARQERDVLLEAAALLQMEPHEVRTLAQIQFIASAEVGRLLDQMPLLIRQLRTTTGSETEMSAERVRGAIQWGATLSGRLATGLPHLYVTAPAVRAFDTPENQVLVAALEAIRSSGRKTGWHRSASPDVGALVRDRVVAAERWLRSRMLSSLPRALITPHTIARVRASRSRRRYQAALDVVGLHTKFVRHLNRDALRDAVQDNALVTSADDVLLELVAGFAIERALRSLGWRVVRPGLVRGGLFLRATRTETKLDLYYQHTPPALSAGSIYAEIQRHHAFKGRGALIPDYVARVSSGGGSRWLMFEVKGVHRPVSDSARAAVQDLLAYRRAFERALDSGPVPYGIGIAWGASLAPSTDVEITLCTPDTLEPALGAVLALTERVARATPA
jgi:hypothetical protein